MRGGYVHIHMGSIAIVAAASRNSVARRKVQSQVRLRVAVQSLAGRSRFTLHYCCHVLSSENKINNLNKATVMSYRYGTF